MNPMLTPQQLADAVRTADLCLPRHPIFGCEPKHIKRLENYLGVSLPRAYREFLGVFGRNTGEVMHQLIITYPAIITLCHSKVMFFENAALPLPKSRIVFASTDCSRFYFDVVDGLDDPPVFELYESTPRGQVAESLSSWLNETVLTDLAETIEVKHLDEPRRAKLAADPYWQETWQIRASAPIQAGDVVRFVRTVERFSNLDEDSEITIEAGVLGEVDSISYHFAKDGISVHVEIPDDSGERLLAIPTAKIEEVELVDSKDRLQPNLTWKDLIW